MKIRDHEMIMYTTKGAIPQSQLHETNTRLAEAKASRPAPEPEPPVSCPLSPPATMAQECRREGCALFVDGACALVRMADGAARETTGKRCPIQGRKCTEFCALNIGGGCVITALKA